MEAVLDRTRSIWVCLLVLTSIPVMAAEPVCPGFVRSIEVNGPTNFHGVAVRDGLAVTADSFGLSTWDLRDPSSPRRLGSFIYGQGTHPGLYHALAVHLDPSTKWACLLPVFDCFDIRDPNSPQPTRFQTVEWPRHIDKDYDPPEKGIAIGRKLIAARHFRYSGAISREIWFLDHTSLPPHEWIKPEGVFDSIAVGDLAFAGDLLLVYDTIGRLVVFDVSEPTAPAELGRVDLARGSKTLVASENVAVVYQDFFGWAQEQWVVDLDNPSSPAAYPLRVEGVWGEIRELDLLGAFGLAAVDQTTSEGWIQHLVEIDFSDPSAPVATASRIIDEDDRIYSLAATPREVVTGRQSNLTIHERRNEMEPVGDSPIAGLARRLDSHNNLGVLANNRAGIVTLDLSDPWLPRKVATLDLGEDVVNVRLTGVTAVVILDDAELLATIDVSDPASPVVLDTIEVEHLDRLLEIDDGIAFVWSRQSNSSGDRPISLIDISDPEHLAIRSQISLPRAEIAELRVRQGIIFVPTFAGDLFTIDATDPDHPEVLGVLESLQRAYSVDFQGDHAFLARGWQVEALDISDPANVQIVRSYENLWATHIDQLSEDLLAIAGNAGYLADFSDLDNPIIFDAPMTSRGWYDGTLVGSSWLRPSEHVIDVVSLECLPPEAEIRSSGRGPTIWFEDWSRYQVTHRSWNFGDGQTSGNQNPVHTYPGPGHYTVTLTVSSPNGADTATEVIEVGPLSVRRQPPDSRRQP
jgi:hypothetical protein